MLPPRYRVEIVGPDPAWPDRFATERSRIEAALTGLPAVLIDHIGSTSVPGLVAKPVIDISIGIPDLADAPQYVSALERIGYGYVPEFEDELPERRFLWLGDPRKVNVHVAEEGSDFRRRDLAFRDALLADPVLRDAYAALKRSLAVRFREDSQAYTAAKTDFIDPVKDAAIAGREPPLDPELRHPVELVDPDPGWPAVFAHERDWIAAALGNRLIGIEHVGSTAVPGLVAKPVLDILVGVDDFGGSVACVAPLEALGYVYVAAYEAVLPERRYFRKGLPPTHHVHLVEHGGDFWRRHLVFRDHLRAHPEVRDGYGELKRKLAALHSDDRNAYTDGKTAFVADVLRAAGAADADGVLDGHVVGRRTGVPLSPRG